MRVYDKTLYFDIETCQMSLRTDYDLLKTVLMNLIDNAIKASSDQGQILLSCKAFSNKIRLTIKDTGYGISEDDLVHIREPFYMADKSRTKADESFGLGLTICSEILKHINGSLSIESELDQGTQVFVEFDFTTS